MMKERQTEGKILKSAIAVLMAVAVAVLTLPGFKMDVRAVNNPGYDYAISAGMDGATGAALAHMFDSSEFKDVDASTVLESGKKIFVGAADNVELPDIADVSTADNTFVIDWGDFQEHGVLYTLNKDVTFSINGSTVRFTSVSGGSSSAEEPAAPAAGTVKADPAAMARTIAEMQARYNAEQAALAQQREADRIYQAKQLQAQIDNEYFRNQNELKANGKSMVVRPDHSAVKSTVNGNYHAAYKNGFAAVALDPLAAPNLFVETWDITSKKSDKAFNSINDWVNENGGTLIGAVQVNIGVKNGKGETVYESENKEPVVNAKFGVPNDGAKYVIVQVLPGGEINVFENPAIENGVATLPLPIGQAAYGVVKLPQ